MSDEKIVSLDDIMEKETPKEEEKKITKNTIITPDMVKNSKTEKADLKEFAPELFVPKAPAHKAAYG